MLEERLSIGNTLTHLVVHRDRRHVIYRTITVA